MGEGNGAEIHATGKLWAMQANGTRGIGMPQQQYVMGGDFATALSTVAAAKLVEVRRELREVGEEIALVTPVNRNVPLAAQQLNDASQVLQCCWGAPVLMPPRLLCCYCCVLWGSLPSCRELEPLHPWVRQYTRHHQHQWCR